MAGASLRFAVTGVAEVSGDPGWLVAAGWAGLVLAVLALYGALALEVEGATGRTVLPVLRRGAARTAVSAGVDGQIRGVADEAGVRQQL